MKALGAAGTFLGIAALIVAAAAAVGYLPLSVEKARGAYAFVTMAAIGAMLVLMHADRFSMAYVFGTLAGCVLGWAMVFHREGHLAFLDSFTAGLGLTDVVTLLVFAAAQVATVLGLKLVSAPLVRGLRRTSRRKPNPAEHDTGYVWTDRTGRVYGNVSRTDLVRLGKAAPLPAPMDPGSVVKVVTVLAAVAVGGWVLARTYDLGGMSWPVAALALAGAFVAPVVTARLANWWLYGW